MKPIEPTIQDAQHEERQVKKGFFKIRSVILKPGLKVWELNITTGILKEATYEESSYDINKKQGRRRINENDNCFYLPAINWKNARKKFNNIFEGKINIIRET